MSNQPEKSILVTGLMNQRNLGYGYHLIKAYTGTAIEHRPTV